MAASFMLSMSVVQKGAGFPAIPHWEELRKRGAEQGPRFSEEWEFRAARFSQLEGRSLVVSAKQNPRKYHNLKLVIC